MPEQPSYRLERINVLIHQQLVLLLKQETRDPRLQMVRVTEVLTSCDLDNAKVFYSVLESHQATIEPLLNKAGGFFRSRLSKTLNLRHTPKLKFIFDPTPNKGARIEDLLTKL